MKLEAATAVPRRALRTVLFLAVIMLVFGCSQNEPSGASQADDSKRTVITAAPSVESLPPPPPPVPTPYPFEVKPYGDAELWLRAGVGERPIAQNHRDLVLSFYKMHLEVGATGIPTLAEIEHYRPYFTSRLKRALACGARVRDQAITEHPGNKPPHVDHDMFVSGIEGRADKFVITTSAPLAENVWVYDVRISETYRGQMYHSANTAKVMMGDGVWRIHDFGIQGSVVGEDSQTLLEMLEADCDFLRRESRA